MKRAASIGRAPFVFRAGRSYAPFFCSLAYTGFSATRVAPLSFLKRRVTPEPKPMFRVTLKEPRSNR
jgi:hypothetical protein